MTLMQVDLGATFQKPEEKASSNDVYLLLKKLGFLSVLKGRNVHW